jgi:TPR repeat protein
MNTKRISLWILIFMFAFKAGYSQTCYEIGLDDGKKEYAKGEVYVNNKNYAQATAAFEKAKDRFRSTKENCANALVDVLDEWTGKCNAAIQRTEQAKAKAKEEPGNVTVNVTLSLSSTSLSFDASGGEASITVATNAASWNAPDNLSWYSTRKSGEQLTVICQPNTATNERTGYLYINAGGKQVKVDIRQDPDPYFTGKQYYTQKKYADALQWFYKSAEQGNALGQYFLGYMYRNGYGVEKNPAEAVKWFSESAEQGNDAAQNNLAFMYLNGTGVERNYDKAIKWFRKSAEQGNDAGQCYLGYMYRNGYGVEQDDNKAVEWYRKSAEQGNNVGQYNLGLMYEKGYGGLTQDYAEAEKWYRKSAEQGYEKAKEALGRLN